MRQPLEFRVIGAGAGVALVVALGMFARYLMSPETRGLEALAVRQLEHQCGMRAECKVRVGDLFPGDWDRLYEFQAGVEQAEIDAAIGPGKATASGRDRTVVLMRGAKVVQSERLRAGTELPIDGELQFQDLQRNVQRITVETPDRWLWANRYPRQRDDAQGGTYFVLTPDDRAVGQ